MMLESVPFFTIDVFVLFAIGLYTLGVLTGILLYMVWTSD